MRYFLEYEEEKREHSFHFYPQPSPFSLRADAAGLAGAPSPTGIDLRRLKDVKRLVESRREISPLATSLPAPIESLRRGDWDKLICGASFEDAADVRNLSLVYALSGVDCIDCAAEESIVNAVNEGIEAAMSIATLRRPWVMISVNDDEEDLHFRKAEFDPVDCPHDCPRPCEKACPASAIVLDMVSDRENVTESVNSQGKIQLGVITERCYGCGRCFKICPYDRIRAVTYLRDPATTSKLLRRNDVDAIEIHTRGRRTDLFNELWTSLGDSVEHVKLVAVSLPDVGETTVSMMKMIYEIMESSLKGYNLWQLDGRPMSGDIGKGATREAIAFAVRLCAVGDKPHGFYQIAGGTNSFTIDSLKKVGLFQTSMCDGKSPKAMNSAKKADYERASIGGIAYGGYARKIVGRVLDKMTAKHGHALIEQHPEYLLEALKEALALVGPVKGYTLPNI